MFIDRKTQKVWCARSRLTNVLDLPGGLCAYGEPRETAAERYVRTLLIFGKGMPKDILGQKLAEAPISVFCCKPTGTGVVHVSIFLVECRCPTDRLQCLLLEGLSGRDSNSTGMVSGAPHSTSARASNPHVSIQGTGRRTLRCTERTQPPFIACSTNCTSWRTTPCPGCMLQRLYCDRWRKRLARASVRGVVMSRGSLPRSPPSRMMIACHLTKRPSARERGKGTGSKASFAITSGRKGLGMGATSTAARSGHPLVLGHSRCRSTLPQSPSSA